ncbi:ECF transporter S component [Candidatus Bathyarchaeota archaeon]|nr:ECF transporter S component [Candidatus Bathyarchaeota archaeon]
MLGVFTALCLAMQLSPRLPNVEFTSFFAFVVGFVFGSFLGVWFGGFVMFVNGFLSPWGFAGVNMPFQIAGMALVGLSGGFYRRFLHNEKNTNQEADQPSAKFYEVAVLGAFFTMVYDVITNLGVAFSYIIAGMQPSLAIMTAFAYGTPFSLIHVSSSFAVFAVIFLPLIRALNNVMVVEKSWLKREF